MKINLKKLRMYSRVSGTPVRDFELEQFELMIKALEEAKEIITKMDHLIASLNKDGYNINEPPYIWLNKYFGESDE